MKTKQQLQNEAMKCLHILDQALNKVPSVPYEKCGTEGKEAWNKLAGALADYRAAMALWRIAE